MYSEGIGLYIYNVLIQDRGTKIYLPQEYHGTVHVRKHCTAMVFLMFSLHLSSEIKGKNDYFCCPFWMLSNNK